VIRSDSPLGGYHANSHIPPPAILSQHPNHVGSGGEPGSGIYYSTPAEIVERKQQRMLNRDGVFMSRDVKSPQGSVESDRDPGVRPMLREGGENGRYNYATPFPSDSLDATLT
jgi:hypothetical protein